LGITLVNAVLLSAFALHTRRLSFATRCLARGLGKDAGSVEGGAESATKASLYVDNASPLNDLAHIQSRLFGADGTSKSPLLDVVCVPKEVKHLRR